MTREFHGAHIVVTGGTGALGRAVVGTLIHGGAVCHIPNLVAAELSGFPFTGHPRVRIAQGVDLTDETAVKAFYAELPPLWASVQIAGGFAMAPLVEISAADFEHQFRMNALTSFLCAREAVRSFRSRPVAPGSDLIGGRIVNIAARQALEPRLGAGAVAYTVAKAAVAALTQSLGEELAPEGIWVNAVAPSILDTPANRSAMPDADFTRWLNVHDVASVIRSLVSPLNKTVRGGVVPVYGRS
jgi:NAD(P)-dependent dehydrogenase (short-subunit alcohol dehydrogenase family)